MGDLHLGRFNKRKDVKDNNDKEDTDLLPARSDESASGGEAPSA